MPARQTRHLAFLLEPPVESALRVFAGVRDLAATHPDWRLSPISWEQPELLQELVRRRSLDGFIGPVLSEQWVGDLVEAGIAVVNLATLSSVASVPTVKVDDRLAGQLVGEHLLAAGCQVFAFAGLRGAAWADERLAGFRSALGTAGETLVLSDAGCLPGRNGPWTDWVAALPAKTGCLAANDLLARHVIAGCRAAGRRVPEDIAVVGVGDRAIESLLANLELSSIVLPHEEVGRQAAASMAALLRGERPRPWTVKLAPERLAVRASSAISHYGDSLVVKALSYLDDHLADPLDMGTLARLMGVSRRSLELRFRKQTGTSPYRLLLARREKLARRLLTQTDLPIVHIAQCVGYTEQTFSHWFRRRTGQSATAFRHAQESRAGTEDAD